MVFSPSFSAWLRTLQCALTHLVYKMRAPLLLGRVHAFVQECKSHFQDNLMLINEYLNMRPAKQRPLFYRELFQ